AGLMSAVGLALAQPASPSPEAQPSVAENTPPPADRRPWNPSVQEAVQWPYPELSRSWLHGLCPDLGDFWLSADYLLWGMRGVHLPALVSVSPPDSRGILGLSGTSVLIGDRDVNRGGFSGGHFAGGVWLDDDQNFGFEGSYFFLAERSTEAAAVSSGGSNSATLGRPFFDVTTTHEDAQLLAIPGQQGTSIVVAATTRLQGAEASAIVGLSGGEHYRLEMILGFRYLDLDDKLAIAQEITFVPNAPVNAGAVIDQADRF